MTDSLVIARKQLLGSTDIDDQALTYVMNSLLGYEIDSADLYFQDRYSESWALEDGLVKNGSFNTDKGVGVRAICGEKTGFAYSNEIVLPALTQAAKMAGAITRAGQNRQVCAWKTHNQSLSLYSNTNPFQGVEAASKIHLLKEMDAKARALDSRIEQVTIHLACTFETVMILASDNSLAADIRPLVRLSISVIAEEDGHRETGTSGGGGRFSLEDLIEQKRPEHYVQEAVRQALVNLKAEPAPAGSHTVVLGPGWSGVLLHEAVGHGLEGDFNRKGSSAFSGRIGDKVASSVCTVVDDATLAGRRGSMNIDDEGVCGQYTTLIENGILKGYMQDKLNASLMGVASTGNGRRESYSHLPMPRMTNTYMLPGQYPPEEIIGSVKKGIYAASLGGGQVDITSGQFVFSTSEAYLIENGKITKPIKGATLIGDGPEAMGRISMVGNDLELDPGVGTCGKDGQSVPVGVGQPTLKLDELTVGGTG